MIEFNLLPDIKLKYIKAKRTKRLVTAVAFVVGGVSLLIFVFLLIYVNVVQKSRISSLSGQINTAQQQLAGNSNLNDILTIQNQLQTLPTIENQLPVTSRLFGYLSELVPTAATISTLAANFTQNTLTINGNADNLTTVNQFVDTLEFSTFSDTQTKDTKAFSDVDLSSFSYSSSSGAASQASYTITLNFNPIIFSPTENVTLTVPSTTTTRSILNQPTDLFVASPAKASGN